MCNDHDINEKLSLLDKLMDEQPVSSRTGQRRTVAARNPLDVTRQERIRIKLEEKQKVQQLMVELKESNDGFAPAIEALEERLRASKSALGSQPSISTA
jgi:hypothetical protein